MACLGSVQIYLAPEITTRSVGVGDAMALKLSGGRLNIGPVEMRLAQDAVTGQHAIVTVIQTEGESFE